MAAADVSPAVQGRLEGKVAVITGGAAGIGEATVRLFTKHGAKVIIAEISDEAGQKLAESLSPRAEFIHCDVTRERDVSAAVDFAIKTYRCLDIMFNNAGVGDSNKESVSEYDMEEFNRVMSVNVKGVMHGIKHAARVMIPNRNGCIISSASVGGIIGGLAGYSYTASKHAVIGLTKNGASELGKDGIRVNCVSPNAIATDLVIKLIPDQEKSIIEGMANGVANLKGVTLSVEDIAEAVLYLASDEAKYVSGHNLVVDGGTTVVNHNWGLYH